jgi:hypothetical protein
MQISPATGRPRAEIIRNAIRSLRADEESAFDKVLHRTRGLWKLRRVNRSS